MNPLPPKSSSSVWRHIGAGITLAASVLVCIWLGYLFDQHRGTRPWGILIGAFLGIGAGLYNFFKEFTDESKKPG
ncbi:MAG: AtpZ/AtpI family protein [Elusimicrobiota bacterium]|jgi:F0F1-type ATP synthase assembly protein I